jgi:DNA-directed RNA polymerase specialized sigma24 family protein
LYQPQHTDQQLLDAIALGDRHATQLVFEQHGSIFVRWLYKQGCGEDEATEILQDAMIVLFQKAQNPSFRLSCAIGTYLFAVGRRL